MKESKEDLLIDELKRRVKEKKSIAFRKAKISKKDKNIKETLTIVLKIGKVLHRKIKEDADKLSISRQKVIINILLKHYGLLRR
jgi:hypothetical protein